jgi:hypothetical protein
MKQVKLFEQFTRVYEAKSIAKIQKEWSKITADMKETVLLWKEAAEEDKAMLLSKLKELTSQKKKSEAELDDIVGLTDVDAELVGESNNAELNESFSSFYFDSPNEFGQFMNSAPAKGETKYLVFAHNKADFNGQEIKLTSGYSMGSATGKLILGIFDDENSAKDAYFAAMKKPEGTMVSFTMGTLLAVTKFRSQYTELEGHLAKVKVK